MSTASRNLILGKLSSTRKLTVAAPYPNLETGLEHRPTSVSSDPLMQFAEKFVDLGGQFMYCEDFLELLEKLAAFLKMRNCENVHCWNNRLISGLGEFDFFNLTSSKRLDKADMVLTTCEGLVANSGSMVFSSNKTSHLQLAQTAQTLIVVAFDDQLFASKESLLKGLYKKYKNELPAIVSFVNGPSSRMIDGQIGTGPNELIVFVMEK